MKSIIQKKVHFIPEKLSHLHPVLARVFAARGVFDHEDLEYGLKALIPFQKLKGIDSAVVFLKEAIIQQKKILIVGDFDADGATSTALAVRALRAFGAKYVDFFVPNRFSYGYGLSPEIVHAAREQFDPDILVTVDNGISSIEGVSVAKSLGLGVIITDHHLPGSTLPNADTIVNPNQPGCEFPSKHLAGVGVIFYVMLGLRAALRESQWFEREHIPEPNMASYLDIVALGTVADVAALDKNNRILVRQGVHRIREKQCVPGIRALFDIAGRSIEKIVASDLGFVAGPRLNAAGRLEDMSLGIACLLAEDEAAAKLCAIELDRLNKERREIESKMKVQAADTLKKLSLNKEKKLPRAIALYEPDWHQGVIGVLASRVKDNLNRPVIIFAKANDTELKGSGRSIHNIHLRDVLEAISTQHPGLLLKFGGHAMAAGVSILEERFHDFSKAFNAEVSKYLKDEDLQGFVETDGELTSEDLSLEFAHLLRESGPWGQAFPEPIFEGVFQVIDQRIVGENHLKIIFQNEALQSLDGIMFNIDLSRWPNHRCTKARIAYRLDINEFRGRKSLQLMIEHMEPIQL